ncbi:hypothetical protein [Chitinophaga vietnamensis]|uniref:hypothetical protein n=1 Tax=Chitinophaga vietnamensis TaxID=2593957 RepID=UPI001177F568|nr:hypothetical protein [Chitinophaga vietnamensis]
MEVNTPSLQHLTIIKGISLLARNYFSSKNQDTILRFVFCGVEKARKITIAIEKLYHELDTDTEMEFPLGILIRSMMMDSLMVIRIKNSVFSYSGTDRNELVCMVNDLCYKFISDGTENFITEIFNNGNLTEVDKEIRAKKFARLFPEAFDLSLAKPKLKRGYKVVIKDLYKESTHPSLITKDQVYDLYSFYSKYDHLSHWTSLSKDIPIENRISKINTGIVLMVFQLRDLLLLAYDFNSDSKEFLRPHIERLENHLHEVYEVKS